MKNKIRVVLDTNVLISALIFPHGIPHEIYLKFKAKRFILLTSVAILEEIEDVLNRSSIVKNYHLFINLSPVRFQERQIFSFLETDTF